MSSAIDSLGRQARDDVGEHQQSQPKGSKLEASEELVAQLEHRMSLLISEGGDVKGLPGDWKTLPSSMLVQMLEETERAYRSILCDKITFFGGCISLGTSTNRLEQILDDLRC